MIITCTNRHHRTPKTHYAHTREKPAHNIRLLIERLGLMYRVLRLQYNLA